MCSSAVGTPSASSRTYGATIRNATPHRVEERMLDAGDRN
jgi:hypothetical protein